MQLTRFFLYFSFSFYFVPFGKLEASLGPPSVVDGLLEVVEYYVVDLSFTLALPTATAVVVSHAYACISVHTAARS
jgi:hypothetical protein